MQVLYLHLLQKYPLQVLIEDSDSTYIPLQDKLPEGSVWSPDRFYLDQLEPGSKQCKDLSYETNVIERRILFCMTCLINEHT